MLIDSINIIYSNTAPKQYSLSDTSTLMSSDGKNTKGKTSLIRFLIWGLGFNVSLTNQFKLMYSETVITLKDSPFISINRKGNKVILKSDDNENSYSLPNDEDKVLKLIFPNVPVDILPQLLGFMYFDQDGGYKAWNRNVVTQRLGNDRSYKISIESLLASLGKVDYQDFLSKQKSLDKVKKETTNFGNLLNSIYHISPDTHAELANVESDIQNLNDQISQRELELTRIKNKRMIYSSSLKDQNNFNSLLKKLSIKIKVGKNIVNVTDENIIQDRHLNTRLTEFEKHYRHMENTMSKELNNLKEKRDVLISTHTEPNDPENLFNSENNFKHLLDLLRSSGISLQDTHAATSDISTAAIKNNKEFKEDIKKTPAYSDIWNTIVFLASKIGLSGSINHHNNRLLASKISESGARRSLTVISYRLGILRYLYDTYNIQPPLIFDSPASSEMDTENLNVLLSMITSQFSEFQTIIATNQETDTFFDKKIIIQDGVIGTLDAKSVSHDITHKSENN
ncbi:hypothetical protein ACFP3T_00775 [Lactiplantibacillus dongliensis]|uniref:Rad50/SbcC-type AAA domain-containing protein n=1 Tax=Lactiplantibacillus dongliensis TaxID=2559919 RepID=A0ABW1R2S3_9LACO|nr:hypothetical protein [Lactiplantibacillus dongliensis]